jgi:hypothetical protein
MATEAGSTSDTVALILGEGPAAPMLAAADHV